MKKIEKNLSCFLTKNSKEFLWKAIIGASLSSIMLLSSPDITSAGHYNSVWHSNNVSNSISPSGFDPYPWVIQNATNTQTFAIVNSSTCWHVSWIVNWHMSSTPSVSSSSTQYTAYTTHWSWSTHYNAYHCSCSRWM